MIGSHITIALLVLQTLYLVDASAITKAPDIEDSNDLENRPPDIESPPFDFGIPPIKFDLRQFGPQLPPHEFSWLSSFKCGPKHRLPNGRPGQCNPTGPYPCCDPVSGWCGKTSGHCACPGCIDYTKIGPPDFDIPPFGRHLLPQKSTITCSANEFQCGDGTCIGKIRKCDDIADCDDLSDEQDCLLELAFNKASTTPCPNDTSYSEICDKCNDCDCTRGEWINENTCKCDLTFSGCRRTADTAPFCDIGLTRVDNCRTCAECPVNECQVFNHKTCRCNTKFSCRARALKLRTCSDPKAFYVEECGTCAACPDKCQWFNTRTCECQTATSWVGCAK